MPNNNEMKNNRTDIDRLFEKGISDVAHEPRKSLSEEDLAAAAAASKSGAGVFLLSHTKEILLCTISFAAGCLIMMAVIHSSAPKSSEPQGNARVTEAQVDGVDKDNDLDLGNHGQVAPTPKHSNPTSRIQPPASQVTSPTSNVSNPTSRVTRPKSNLQTPESQVPSQIPSSKSQEPVIVKKTIVQRDTVFINETVIIKDTTYVP